MSRQNTASTASAASQAGTPALHPVDEMLPAGKMTAVALQHVASMYAGVAAPPLIIGGAAGLTPAQLTTLLAANLFIAGVATLLQTLGFWKVGSRLPFVNGVSFATVSPILAVIAAKQGAALPLIFGSTIVAGLCCFLFAPVFCRLVRYFPPVVSGTVITLIGVSLLPVAGNWAQGGNAHAPGYGSLANLGLAGLTLLSVLLFNRFLTGFLQRISILFGLLVGTLAAIPLGRVDFHALRSLPVFELPHPFAFGAPKFEIASIVAMLVVMVVSMTESTADMIALGEVVERPVDDRTIAGGLRADGLATAFGGVFNGFICSAFAQNIGLVALTKIRSRFVVALSGGFLILMGLMPVVGGLVSLVPQPVLGGAGVVLFGSVAVAGVRTLGKADLSAGSNAVIVAVSLAFGIFPIAYPDFYHALPQQLATVLSSGISAGCLLAVTLNLLFNHLGRGREIPPAHVPEEQITALGRVEQLSEQA
ncbi:xanthine permease [Kitasatospora sp. MAP12-15]|uniref:nucleobase:cation symporter-2 family protein n=1 Tax=unclassified Kitasatospora TaxID=2633591 RepID=UPI002475040E|nr:nucleobase:cation symporter-2 family protein [Kitasatospora sp. MAP12-44]MDH6109670.1 xanthine permease [Kitasatospora sp. MAP12-44]